MNIISLFDTCVKVESNCGFSEVIQDYYFQQFQPNCTDSQVIFICMTHGPSLIIWFVVGKLFNVAFESDKSFIE